MQQKWKKLFERENGLHRVDETMSPLTQSIPYPLLRPKIIPRALWLRLPNGNDAFYINPQSWAGFFDCIKQILVNKKSFEKYLNYYSASKKNFISVSKKIGKIAPKSGTDKLLDLFTRYHAAADDFMLIGEWGGFFLPEYGEKIARELVEKISDNPEKQGYYLKIILSSQKPNAIQQERRSILKIALEKKSSHKQLLLRHRQKFLWIPCINVFTPPWEEKFFKQALADLSNRQKIKQELEESLNCFTNIRKQFKKLAAEQKPNIRMLMTRAQTTAFLKDDRDDTRRKARFYAIPLYRAIAKALSVPFLELEWYTIQEICNTLKTNSRLPKNILNERKKGFAIVAHNGKTVVKTGAQYKKYLALVTSSLTQINARNKMITGIGASGGIKRGKVCIAPNALSLNKVKSGDILVTIATHPDYVPAMRRSIAIITDEGGLTCHAAIISRELKIPCIIETSIATSVLKDRDMVEVDGNRGVVKKLD